MNSDPADSPDLSAARLVDALLSNDRVRASRIGERWAAAHGPLAFLEQGVVPALETVGLAWEAGRAALSQVYVSGRICEAIVDELFAAQPAARQPGPRVGVAVLADQHALGKRVVSMTVRAAGYDVVDYGVGLDPADLASRAARDQVEVLLVSVLLLPSAMLVRALKDELLRLGVEAKLIVGGAPFRLDPSLWRTVGADAGGASASDAIRLIQQVTSRP